MIWTLILDWRPFRGLVMYHLTRAQGEILLPYNRRAGGIVLDLTNVHTLSFFIQIVLQIHANSDRRYLKSGSKEWQLPRGFLPCVQRRLPRGWNIPWAECRRLATSAPALVTGAGVSWQAEAEVATGGRRLWTVNLLIQENRGVRGSGKWHLGDVLDNWLTDHWRTLLCR